MATCAQGCTRHHWALLLVFSSSRVFFFFCSRTLHLSPHHLRDPFICHECIVLFTWSNTRLTDATNTLFIKTIQLIPTPPNKTTENDNKLKPTVLSWILQRQQKQHFFSFKHSLDIRADHLSLCEPYVWATNESGGVDGGQRRCKSAKLD